jgi:hypothetical protein
MATIQPDFSALDVEAFRNICVLLRSTYRHLQILFETSVARRRLLNNVAPILFGDLNKLLIESLVLQICQITDPEESQGRKNLTVKFLLKYSDFQRRPSEFHKLERLSKRIHNFRSKILPARNRFVGYLDRDSVLAGRSLGAVPEPEWDQFWRDLHDFINILHNRYFGHVFNLNQVTGLSDADKLINALQF